MTRQKTCGSKFLVEPISQKTKGRHRASLFSYVMRWIAIAARLTAMTVPTFPCMPHLASIERARASEVRNGEETAATEVTGCTPSTV